MQSALAPAGPVAQEILAQTWIMTGGAAIVLALVMGLFAYAAVREPSGASTALWIAGGGVVFPALVLGALLAYSAAKTALATAPVPGEALRIEVDGRQWWWEVRYPSPAGAIVTANEVRVPVGVPVEVVVTSPDVIHSFWVPSLAGKVDMVPGHSNRLALSADRAGVYRGQCAEYCGVQHAHMALDLVAEPADTFRAWLTRQAEPAAAPATPEAARGLEAFLALGCGGCHVIRGTPALGPLGPDLTHVGGRRTLGAGVLPNDVRALRAWIATGHMLKPGNHMPSYAHLDDATLGAISEYLAGLR